MSALRQIKEGAYIIKASTMEKAAQEKKIPEESHKNTKATRFEDFQ